MSVLERVERRGAELLELRESDRAHERHHLRSRLKQSLVDRLGLSEIAAVVATGDTERTREELEVVCSAVLHAGSYDEVSQTDFMSLSTRFSMRLSGSDLSNHYLTMRR